MVMVSIRLLAGKYNLHLATLSFVAQLLGAGGQDMMIPDVGEETAFWQRGLYQVAGLDEAGRGPWAGPVYAAAVILPQRMDVLEALQEVRDSKVLSPRRRVACFDRIMAVAVAVGVGFASAGEIDALGILPATRLAMHRALRGLGVTPDALIIDALALPDAPQPQRFFPRADARSLSVASASIIAKVTRDRWMAQVAEPWFPGYGFARHKGYGTPQHREALKRLGPCPLHRASFRPIAELYARSPLPPEGANGSENTAAGEPDDG